MQLLLVYIQVLELVQVWLQHTDVRVRLHQRRLQPLVFLKERRHTVSRLSRDTKQSKQLRQSPPPTWSTCESSRMCPFNLITSSCERLNSDSFWLWKNNSEWDSQTIFKQDFSLSINIVTRFWTNVFPFFVCFISFDWQITALSVQCSCGYYGYSQFTAVAQDHHVPYVTCADGCLGGCVLANQKVLDGTTNSVWCSKAMRRKWCHFALLDCSSACLKPKWCFPKTSKGDTKEKLN